LIFDDLGDLFTRQECLSRRANTGRIRVSLWFFKAEDLNSALAHLDAMGVHYYGLRPIPDINLRQCFLKDPNGITIE
jgi:hypothetical protein